jgi:hypothetical protein
MVQGIEKFGEWFKDHKEKYVIIGGTACSINFDDIGEKFRTTKDIDMVLIVEALDKEFGQLFWDFILDGEYSIREKSERRELFRFKEPKDTSYPKEIELFSTIPEGLTFEGEGTITPLPIDEDVSSLSAILLNDDYYKLLLKGKTEKTDYPVIDNWCLILFKIRAWIDFTNRQAEGQKELSRQIKKHKNDIYRLSQLLEPNIVEIPESVHVDLMLFIDAMQSDTVQLKSLGITGTSKETILQRITDSFSIEK